jgi:hypothetical protein
MVLTALVLLALAIGLCAAGIYRVLRALGLDPVETLLWLGVLERPVPRTSRRRKVPDEITPGSPTAAPVSAT